MNIDVSRFDPVTLTKGEVDALVGSMYSAFEANGKILAILSQANRQFVVECLDSLTRSDDANKKANAVQMLVWLEGPNAVTWAKSLLNESDAALRWAGCNYVAETRSSASTEILMSCLKADPAGNVRYIAAACLGAVGDESAIPALRETMDLDEGTDFEGRTIKAMALRAIRSIEKRENAKKRQRVP